MSEPTHKLLVDTHVHLYAGSVGMTFKSAANRFAASAKALGLGSAYDACLMLTETARDNVFVQLIEAGGEHDGWQIKGEASGSALWASHAEHGRLLVVAGGQTVTSEGIEVLSLGTRRRFDERQPIDETIGQVVDSGALAVLPYGLGKWLGKRGQIVAEAFDRWHDRGARLGDNAGRPRLFCKPKLFTKSEELGHAVLPGSDPLRTGHGKTAAGGYGVVLSVPVDEDNPTLAVVEALGSASVGAPVFGGRVGLARCVSEQVALRVNKKLGR